MAMTVDDVGKLLDHVLDRCQAFRTEWAWLSEHDGYRAGVTTEAWATWFARENIGLDDAIAAVDHVLAHSPPQRNAVDRMPSLIIEHVRQQRRQPGSRERRTSRNGRTAPTPMRQPPISAQDEHDPAAREHLARWAWFCRRDGIAQTVLGRKPPDDWPRAATDDEATAAFRQGPHGWKSPANGKAQVLDVKFTSTKPANGDGNGSRVVWQKPLRQRIGEWLQEQQRKRGLPVLDAIVLLDTLRPLEEDAEALRRFREWANGLGARQNLRRELSCDGLYETVHRCASRAEL